jgi:pimeloyl-ACP methyl ester carboxylesterase
MEPLLLRNKLNGISYLSGGHGPVVLLLHGQPGSSERWRTVAASLLDRFTIIVPDLPGFGQSDPIGTTFSFEDTARSIRTLLNSLGIKKLFIGGHDLGTPVAVTMIRLFPELELSGVMLSDAILFSDTFDKLPFFRKLLFLLVLMPMQSRVFASEKGLRSFYKMMVFKKDLFSWDQFIAPVSPSSYSTHAKVNTFYKKNFKAEFLKIEAGLFGIKCPLLILWGANDSGVAVETAKRLKTIVKSAELRIYSQCGHFIQEECPEKVASDLGTFFSAHLG